MAIDLQAIKEIVDINPFAGGAIFGALFAGGVHWSGHKGERKLQNLLLEEKDKKIQSMVEEKKVLEERIKELHSQLRQKK